MPTVCLLSEYASAAKTDVADKLPHFGLITGNTGGKWLEENPKKALKTIAQLGYKELEFGGSIGGMKPVELNKFLKDCGLKALAGATSIQAMYDEKQLLKDITSCKTLGQEYIVCYWPWLDGGETKHWRIGSW